MGSEPIIQIITAAGSRQLKDALELVRGVFMEFEAPEYSAQGVAEFMAYVADDAMAARLRRGESLVWTARLEAELTGVLAGSPAGHINLLFVPAAFQRRGIARALLGTYTRACRAKGVAQQTVNASPYAAEVYRRLGFAPTGPETTQNGIRYTPMVRALQ